MQPTPTEQQIEVNFYPVVLRVGFDSSLPQPNMSSTVLNTSNISNGANGTVMTGGTMQSPNYSPSSSGWQINSNGNVEFDDGKFRGTITATTGTIGGWTINSTSIYTGTEDHSGYTANAGDLTIYSDGSDASIHAKNFYIDTSGNLVCTSATVSGGITTTAGSLVDGQYLTAGSVASASANLALRGWTFTGAFSTSDADTVAWASGTFTASDGTVYSITGANTGNMTALTYIYLDIAVSTTAFQTTTTAATAVGNGKVLIAIAQNQTSRATFQVFGGSGGNNLLVDNLVANSASTNEFVSNTAQLANLVVTNAKINDLAVDKLTAGSITSKAITLAVEGGTGDTKIQAGKTDFTNTESGFILGLDDSDSDLPKFYIGDATTYFNWNGSTLAIKGSLTITGGSGYANLTDKPTALSDINAGEGTKLTGVESGADVTGSHTAAAITGQGNLATLSVIGNAYITDLAVDKLSAGTISSKSIVLSIAAGTGDVEIRAGIATGDFANSGAASGFILGLDDSDSDKPKFYIGGATTYMKWDGTNLGVVAGTGSSIDFSYVAGATKPADNATVGATFNVNIAGGGTANTQVGNDGYATLFRQDKFGDGSDGDVTISGDTTLTADMYYNNLTIDTTKILNPGGYRIFVKGTLTINGTGKIQRIGNAGGNGTNGGTPTGGDPGGSAGGSLADGFLSGAVAGVVGGVGGAGGNNSNGTAGTGGGNGSAVTSALLASGANGITGGAGGNATTVSKAGGGGGAGGTGGVATAALTEPKTFPELTIMRDFSPTTPVKFTAAGGSAASGGGGGGGGDTYAGFMKGGGGGAAGGSGGNGGIVLISAKIIANAGTISVKGGAGGNGGNGGNGQDGFDTEWRSGGGGGGGAGGDGGSGGVLILIYQQLTNTGTITSAGGAGGTKGTGGSSTYGSAGSDGTDGATGTTGVTIQIQA